MSDNWYFAYGSNLDTLQMEERKVQIQEARKARIKDYRLAFNKWSRDGSVKANVIRQPGSEVWGVVYRCKPETLDKMDDYEGVPSGDYERSQVEVETAAGDVIKAITYVACVICSEGRPTAKYLVRIVFGAKEHALPNEYIEQIERIAAYGIEEQNPNRYEVNGRYMMSEQPVFGEHYRLLWRTKEEQRIGEVRNYATDGKGYRMVPILLDDE